MVLEAIEGETIARKIQRDPEFEDARGAPRRRLRRCAGPDPCARSRRADRISSRSIRSRTTPTILDGLGQPHPVLELVRNWLLDHQPPSERRTLVHGDFRLGNMIVGPARTGGGDRLGARPRRRPDGGPRLAVREGVAVRRGTARRRARRLRPAVRRVRGGGRRRRRPRRSCTGGRCSAPGSGRSCASSRPTRTSAARYAATNTRRSAVGCARTSTTCC